MLKQIHRGFSLSKPLTENVIRNISAKSGAREIKHSLTSRQTCLLRNNQTKNTSVLDVKQYCRNLSTLPSSVVPPAATVTAASKEESREFMAVFPDIVRDLTDAGRHTDIPEVTKWFAKVMQYNCTGGKKNRGLAVVMSYKILAESDALTPENIRLANILGWCVEMLQSMFLVQDDIVDSSISRRGKPSWYRLEHVGLTAVNDALMIEQGIYVIMKKYFSNHPNYVNMIELFHDVTLKTSMGQCLDLQSNSDGRPQFDVFTMHRYEMIVKYKTAYYTFQLPIALAMFLAGNDDVEMHRQAKTILLEIGQFFQIQDDFLDCFGDAGLIGKSGNDIREGKCTWLATMALQRATPAQKELFLANYGVNSDESVSKIIGLYHDLRLPHIYAAYEDESYNLIRTHIQQISRGLPHKMFFKILETIYKRDH